MEGNPQTIYEAFRFQALQGKKEESEEESIQSA
jgi:hypothetical protein